MTKAEVKRKSKKVTKKVSVKINSDKLNNVDTPSDPSIITKAIKKAKTKESIKTRAMLISRNNYPNYINYGDEKIMVSPRSRFVVDKELLPKDLPNGLLVKKLK